MKLINYRYKSSKDLELFIDKNIVNHSSVLIQLFCGELDVKKVEVVLETLTNKLPNSTIIGASTSGEIINGVMEEESIQISFSIFEHTTIRTTYYHETNYTSGLDAANNFLLSNTKAVIAFSEGLKSTPELFLDGFTSANNDIPISGGSAGDNLDFTKTFIVLGSKIYFDGIVLCALDSDNLIINVNYSLKWSKIGNEMTITKAKGNTVYEIDNRPIEDIYKFYFGNRITQDFPLNLIEFPLIRKDENTEIARSIITKDKDGGYIYGGNFRDGDKVKFAVGNIERILNQATNIYEQISSNPVEATYIYSCSARKQFLGTQLNHEFGLIDKIAPTSGFITYGEFFHSKTKNHMLNITTTTLSLSESNKFKKIEDIKINKHKITTLNSLVNLLHISDEILNQYKELLDNSSIVSKADLKGKITYVNDEFCRVSGYTREELIGQNHNIVKHPQTDSAIFRDMWRAISSKNIWNGTIKNLSKDGSSYYVKSVIMPILDDNEDIVEYIAARTNVTELVRQDEIIKQQYKDELTGLQNRSSMHHKLSTLLNQYSTLILINIDRFSDINDYFGYEEGDKVLKAFALELSKKHGEVFRISGDEFAILCEHELDEQTKNETVALMVELENFEFKIGENKLSLLLSCGVANGHKSEVYKLAHIALKENKSSNNQVIFYNDNKNLSKQIDENIKVISKIRTALKEDRFVPVFQGIVDNKTKKIVKYEALIRLKERDGTLTSPFFFLEHSKKAKLYTKLTKVMIKKSFEKFANEPYEFSINLSLQDIAHYKVVNVLMEHLEKYKCGSRVVLEIVESEGIENFDELQVFIKQVKKYGCKIAIDDFGTGYSNFSYLAKLNVDFIKIDGSLVKDIEKDKSQLTIVESILHFAKNMNIKTIAEFVENENIYNKLNKLGVDFSQGYLFSIPKEELI